MTFTPHVVKVFDHDELSAFEAPGELLSDDCYTSYDAALQVAISHAEHLCRDMITADAVDLDDRVWTIEYHDLGANVLEDGDIAWRVEVSALHVHATPFVPIK